MKGRFLIIFCLLSACSTNKNVAQLNKWRDLAVESALSGVKNFKKEEKILQYNESASIEWIDKDGNMVKGYNFSERKLGFLSYLPLLSFFLPRNYENYEIIITLKNNKIIDVKSFYGVITLESESSCNEAIFSCIVKSK